ncbi:hypothetical protein [Mucilaginibacter phyllosphaerae]|uniref:Uncharacterized protein n=1 Tax=Mucilaginibacter phyllosphaerae TaxID=1812349 RepID=A0A4Y8AJ89_9SPHI|nr:hypothetical protein [Mucilaginibacter phyllosphaerae]MBB3967868.1 hypothetical protein [Mucilaginibacter phyllosphaerae]TEW69090.1 hypothetical protein E2R65_02690 [Mucilaginibacter phyllosphaerae]GGH02783.1 hypothetical protein GCM10007352_05160 [Mucilaginibacter phyllosphaerae]
MKTIKIAIIALVLTLGAQFAKAQVRVGIGVHIGTPVRYVERPYYDDDYNRVVYYDRPVVVRRVYARPVYRERYYERPVYRQVVYRERGWGRGRGWGHGHGRGHGRW